MTEKIGLTFTILFRIVYVLRKGHCVKCWDYSGESNKYAPHGTHCLDDIMEILMPEKGS